MKPDYLKSPSKTFYFAIYPYRWRFFAMVALVVVGNAVSYSLPYFLKLIVDKVSLASGAVTFADVSLPFYFLVGILVIQEVLFRLGHVIETYIAPDVYRHVTVSLYDGLIKRPASYFEDKFSGDLGRRIEQVASTVLYFVEDFPWEMGWIAMTVVMSGVMLGLANAYVFLAFLAWLVFFIATGAPLLVWHYRASEKVAAARAALSGSIVDTLGNIPLVQSFGGVPFEQLKNGEMASRVVEAERHMRWVGVLDKLQCGVSLALLGSSLTYVSIVLFTMGQFTIGDFVLVAATIPSLVGVIWSFGEAVARASRSLGEMSDAVASLREGQGQLEGGKTSKVRDGEYPIEFEGVRFRYPSAAASVFDGFSLRIGQGEKVGIVGASGAGKSTLVKLLLRQHDFGGGDIRIGGVPIRDFSLKAFHGLISYVPQDTSLFHRTLLENIRYAKTDATAKQAIEASRQADADAFIRAFPEGYATKVGERGVKLSGGQRQRIALARAILADAPVLVLDEATSSLDTESETSIQAALSRLFEGRTVIAIAHRLSTLRAMNRIVVLDNGRIVESGAPQELLKKEGGMFRKMWEHQKDGFVS